MSLSNKEIARLFDRLADLLQIDDANPFRVRAYRNAAETVRSETRRMADLVAQGEDLSALPAIGDDIAEKIRVMVESGRLPALEEVERRVPGELSDMMKLGGLGPKRVKALFKALNIAGMEDLERAARSGRIRQLPGFGRKTEEMILERAEAWSGAERRTLLADAEKIAEPLIRYLEQSSGVKRLVVAGSYRRRKETVGDLDILATVKKDSDLVRRFVEYKDVKDVVSHGSTRSTVRLASGVQVDLRVVPEVSYGAALHYFTGSKAHNVALRKMAVRKNLKINEYGVYRGDERVAGKTEKEVYRYFDMDYVPPELRENHGELEAARAGELPVLVRLGDIRGDLHLHTTGSDGRSGLADMARAAAERGWEYMAVSDRSHSAAAAGGLDEKRLRKQMEDIDQLNEDLDGITVLKSVEVDILADGSLDLPDHVLRELDLAVCAVHSDLHLSRHEQTERVLRAMDNPYVNILAHPTGRLINERDALDMDLERVMEGAAERGCFLEVNGQPERLDLGGDACRLALELGVGLAISSDAHGAESLEHMRFGVDQARRGWLKKDHVINTCSLTALKKLLERD